MSQTEWVLQRLKEGPITAMDALNQGGCFRLAARIGELKGQGYKIMSQKITLPTGKKVSQYHLNTTH